MATLALSVAGAAAGGALLPSGVAVLGATVGGAAIGQAVGAVAGSYIDNALFGASGQSKQSQGPSASDLKVSGSTEGAAISRLYGRARVSGQMIWATSLEFEVVSDEDTSVGGKGLTGGAAGSGQTGPTQYRYFANVAFGLCEGEITRVGRIWADGKELKQSDYVIRVHKGSETQLPDSLIEAKEGADKAPAYRGLAYIVFERMALARFGSRIPQLSFEVFRAVDDFEKSVRAVTVIPSAGEFVYEKDPVFRTYSGVSVPENVHTSLGGSDWSVSMDQLEDQLSGVSRVSLFVSWFGDDLRAGQCTLTPRVDSQDKETEPDIWQVAELGRANAQAVSVHNGAPAYGGTPTDASVVSAIQDLTARGYGVTFTPFVLMDVADGNSLPDPYTGQTGQSAYPWRGRITVDPAPGQVGTPDKTALAGPQVASFVGSAAISDFSIVGEAVAYSGPSEWSYRRMILHYAHLCKAAGGVEVFVLGTEMRGLTQVRDAASSYPFVAALVQLASDVKAVLGSGTLVTYAADWSEYFGHQPQDGSGDVFFHLDPVWSSSDIDAVGVDIYWPLADWRDGGAHLDAQSGARSIYDLSYLKSNIAGGEGHEWYYASASDRDDQLRTSITDGSGKPWVFRFKDIKSWWESEHFDRPGGAEQALSTAWAPQSKPIWFMELGCPAVDKGANQPNVFVDPKSSESAWPYYSRQVRDDLIQRRYLQAFIEFFDTDHEDYVAGSNPTSTVYDGRMVDLDHAYVYCWDARPYPAFPQAVDIWADGGNWEFGHWFTGRLAGGPLAQVVAQIMQDYGFSRYSAGELTGSLAGYVIDRLMSARDALQPLELSFFFDSFESGGIIRLVHRGRSGIVANFGSEELVEAKREAELYQITRGQETELPRSAKISYIDGDVSYRQAAVGSRRLVVASDRVASAQLPVIIPQWQAQQISESWLQETWAAREVARFTLPPSRLALEPGDVVSLLAETREFPIRITRSEDGHWKSVEGRSIEPGVYDAVRTPTRLDGFDAPSVFGPSSAVFLDLPLLGRGEVPHAGWVGAYQSPWPGGVAFYRSADDAGYLLKALPTVAATIGVTLADFHAGPIGRYDFGNVLRVRLEAGSLQSAGDVALLGGRNLAALENADGGFEVIQFRDALLVGENSYELRGFLRGQGGTEDQMSPQLSAGAGFVLLNSAITQVEMGADEIGLPFNWKYGPSNQGIGDVGFKDEVRGFNARGLLPFSPVHVKASRSGNDVTISWVRRARVDGDSWDLIEVPLGETSEAYEVDILDGSQVVRTLTSFEQHIVYSEAQQVEDFGAVQPSYLVRVFQMSSTLGRGVVREAAI